MRNNTYFPPGLQAEKLPLMERARQNLRRREVEKTASASVRNRKSAAENASVVSDLHRATLVIASPSSPTSHTPLSHTDMLKLIREVRARYTPSLSYQRRQETEAKNRDRAARRLPPIWSKAKESDRAPAYMQAILETGMATTFTLNFSPDVLRAAEKAREGAFHNLRSRITRELKKAFPDSPSLVCGLDRTASGRLHIHGALVLNPSQRDLALAALRRAGGKWANSKGQDHQVHMQADQWSLMDEDFSDVQRPLDAGWAGYCTKLSKRLRSETNHSTVYASPEIKRQAEDNYNAIRNEVKQDRSSKQSVNVD